MNYRYILNQFALLVLVLGLTSLGLTAFAGLGWLFPRSLESIPGDRNAFWAFLWTGLSELALGALVFWWTQTNLKTLGRRDALLLVALTWVIGVGLGALPYYLFANLAWRHFPDHPFQMYVNCYFESMSGFTTAGSSVLSDIEILPKSILFWRSLTHWIGGVGIVVLFVAIFPSLGIGGKRLFKVESSGPTPEGLSPQIRDTARMLWIIYGGLTVSQTVLLRWAGMDWFDALCHTFGTLASGGFSTRNASLAAYPSIWIQLIVIFFMILSGVNFGLFYWALRGKVKNVWQDVELRWYLMLIFGGSIIVSLSILRTPLVFVNGDSFEPEQMTWLGVGLAGFFTTISLQTTTGFCTADYNNWPFYSQAILMFLIFVGGSAGSTAGGFKVVRLWIVLRVLLTDIERAFRPTVIRPIKIGSALVDDELKLVTVTYAVSMIMVIGLGTVLLNTLEPADSKCNLATAASACLASFCTTGPGLDAVGAPYNFGWFSSGSKWILSLIMLLGRLEILTVLVLLTPRFWRAD